MRSTHTAGRTGLGAGRPGQLVRGVESPRRVLQVLLSFTERRPHATISDLAQEIAVPVSTCYRYVGLLRELGLVDEGPRATYHVTPRIMLVARAVQCFNSLVVCVESVPSNRAIRYIFETGYSLPLGVGSSGKLLLALLPESEQADYIAQIQPRDPDLARRVIANEAEFATYAAEGWASGDGEYENGVWAGAAAIRAARPVDGDVGAALVVAGPSFRIAATDQSYIRQVLLDAAVELTIKLGR
jgi:DNA-binding IclR family transcriptional regulator